MPLKKILKARNNETVKKDTLGLLFAVIPAFTGIRGKVLVLIYKRPTAISYINPKMKRNQFPVWKRGCSALNVLETWHLWLVIVINS